MYGARSSIFFNSWTLVLAVVAILGLFVGIPAAKDLNSKGNIFTEISTIYETIENLDQLNLIGN